MASREGSKFPKFQETEDSEHSNSTSESSSETQADERNGNGTLSLSLPAVLVEPWNDFPLRSHGRNGVLTHATRSWPLISTRMAIMNSHGESSGNDENQPRSGEDQSSSEDQPRSGEDQSSREDQPRSDEDQSSSEDQPRSGEDQSNSEDQPRSGDVQRGNDDHACVSHGGCCAAFTSCYNISSRKTRNSWFIYIFQFFLTLLSISAVVMGSIYYSSCNVTQSMPLPILPILMGIFVFIVICLWVDKVRRKQIILHYWNYKRNILIIFFVIFLILLLVELILFIPMSPKDVQPLEEGECVKTFYDYLCFLNFATIGSLLFTAFLYLPHCCIYSCNYTPPVIYHVNGHYRQV